MASTRFTDLVGCRLPVQNAAMGGVGSAALAAAVAGAGGLGMTPSYVAPPKTQGRIGTNFLVPGGFDLDAIAALSPRVRVVEFFYGEPDAEPVGVAHGGGALSAWQVGSVAEAQTAAKAGCDFVVAQGTEAGGHVRGRERLDVLLPAVLEAVPIPVVAAGGISTAERVADLMGRGADAVRVGTRFVAAKECDAHPDYVRRILEAKGPGDTALTTHFNDGWPGAPHRVLSSALKAAKATGWREVTPPSRGLRGPVDFMALYAGEGVGDVHSVEPAGQIVKDLMRLVV